MIHKKLTARIIQFCENVATELVNGQEGRSVTSPQDINICTAGYTTNIDSEFHPFFGAKQEPG